jgi:hypothetical protein
LHVIWMLSLSTSPNIGAETLKKKYQPT